MISFPGWSSLPAFMISQFHHIGHTSATTDHRSMYRYRSNVHAFRDFSTFLEFSINSDAASHQERFVCLVRMWIIQLKVNI